MTPSPSDRCYALFDAALDMDPAARERFLEELATEDRATADEIRSLIARFESESDALEEPMTPRFAKFLDWDDEDFWEAPTEIRDQGQNTPHQPKERDGVPDQIGPYPIIHRIGEGGMGTVYLAKQLKPEREVALKVIHQDRLPRESRARFEAEYRVLALMNHHHIARIYEADITPRGNPYFTMEYVDGMPINRFCKEHQLGLRERLELFEQVCEGVLHAHQKAVVHRDLKPSNILVTTSEAKPVVKLIDFGIAKGLDVADEERAFETKTGTFIGTRDYMSPEQMSVGGEVVDTRSDIFALGVVLYELLTGLLPFDHHKFHNMAFDKVLRIYREEDPPRPSKRVREAGLIAGGGDFNPGNFPDPREIADPLTRELDWIVIKAMEKDINRRYETVAALQRDIHLFLSGDPITARPPSLAYRWRKFAARHRALVLAASITLFALIGGLSVALWSQRQTHIALSQLQTTYDFLVEMLTQPDPQERGIQAKVVDVLGNAERVLEGNPPGGPDFEARIRTLIGKTYAELGSHESARYHLTKAVAIKERLDGETHPDTARTRFYLAKALRKSEHYSEALEVAEKTLEHQINVLGKENRDTLQTLTEIATIHGRQLAYDVSEAFYREAWALQNELFGAEDRDTVKSLVGIATCHLRRKDYKEARKYLSRALPIQRQVLGDGHPETLATMRNLANCLKRLHEFARAEALYRETVRLRSAKLGPEHKRTQSARYSLAQCLNAQQKYEEAEQVIEELVAARRETLGDDNPGTIRARNLLYLVITDSGDPQRAVPLFRKLLEDCNAKKLHGLAIAVRHNLGYAMLLAGSYLEAAEVLEQALTFKISQHGPQSPMLSNTLAHLGEAYQGLKRHEKAVDLMAQSWKNVRTNSPGHPENLMYKARYANGLIDLGRIEEAEKLLLECLEDAIATKNQYLPRVQSYLARLYNKAGQPERAAAYQPADAPSNQP